MTDGDFARRSARVILVDTADQALLFRSEDFWFTPGGGIEDGETTEQAAARELWEETGLRLAPDRLGPLVAVCSGYADLGWICGMIQDAFYFHRAPAGFTVDTSGFQPLEVSTVSSHRWWTADEIEASGGTSSPGGWGRCCAISSAAGCRRRRSGCPGTTEPPAPLSRRHH